MDQHGDERELESRLLDRLVDGEVAESEYHDLIQQLESRPENWRSCALAFLEAQAWRQSLRQLSSIEPASHAVSGEPSASPGPATDAMAFERVDRANRAQAPVTNASAERWRPRRSRWTWLAVAATGLMAFALGRFSDPSGTSPQVSQKRSSLANASPDSSRTTTVSDRRDPDLEFVLKDFWQGHSAVTPEFRRSLERSGTAVVLEHGYIPLQTTTGEQVLLPYEDVHLVPVGNQPN